MAVMLLAVTFYVGLTHSNIRFTLNCINRFIYVIYCCIISTLLGRSIKGWKEMPGKLHVFFYYGGGQLTLKKFLWAFLFYIEVNMNLLKIFVLHTFTVDIFFTTNLTQIPSTTSSFVLTLLQGTLSRMCIKYDHLKHVMDRGDTFGNKWYQI